MTWYIEASNCILFFRNKTISLSSKSSGTIYWLSTKDLYNTGYYLLKKNYGSYRYKGNWQTIDHLILSGALLDGHSVWKADRRLTVFSASFLLEEDKTYFGYKPCPTYRGPRYVGGYSDHLPIYIDLKKWFLFLFLPRKIHNNRYGRLSSKVLIWTKVFSGLCS